MSQTTSEADRIERDLDQTRARMDERLSEIGDRLSPGQILDDIMKQVRGSEGGAFANDLLQSIRANPLPAALTGIGLAWLMASNPRPAAPSGTMPAQRRWSSNDELDREIARVSTVLPRYDDEDALAYEGRVNEAKGSLLGVSRSVEDTHESFSQKIAHALKAAKERIADAGQGVVDQIGALASKAGETSKAAGNDMADAVQAVPKVAGDLYKSIAENPVLLGSVGLAIGALLGAVVPQVQQEQELLDSIAGKARDAAATMAQAAVDKGTDMAGAALKAGRESLERHGLGSDVPLSKIAAEAKTGELIDGVAQAATDALKAVDPKSV